VVVVVHLALVGVVLQEEWDPVASEVVPGVQQNHQKVQLRRTCWGVASGQVDSVQGVALLQNRAFHLWHLS
jgi:hypothetical protein